MDNSVAGKDEQSKKNSFGWKYVLILILAIAAVACLVFMPRHKQYFSIKGDVWTTSYHITFEAENEGTFADSVRAVLNRIDASASAFNHESLLWQINSGASEVADDVLLRLYSIARGVHEQSDGAYDPTVMPLVNAWGFGYKTGDMPSKVQIDSILEFVGLEKIRFQGKTIVKQDPRVQLDFSSIAKGMACDEVGLMFRRNGVENYMVEIGGEVVAHGVNSRGEEWHVSVDMPVAGESHESVVLVTLKDCAIATSGNYRRFKEVEGKRVSHIVNPKTGESAESSLLSATVVATDCALADAWSTACMAMGAERTKAEMERRGDLGVMTIESDSLGRFVVWSNAAFARLVR